MASLTPQTEFIEFVLHNHQPYVKALRTSKKNWQDAKSRSPFTLFIGQAQYLASLEPQIKSARWLVL